MNRVATLIFVGMTIAALALGYNLLKVKMALEESIKNNTVLEGRLSETKARMEGIKKDVDEKEVQINMFKKKLDELAYPARLKNSLSAAQSTINILNEKLSDLRKEREALKRENFSMKARVKNNARQIISLLKELQNSKKQLSDIVNQKKEAVSSSADKISKKTVASGKREVLLIKKRLADFKKRYDKLFADKQSLELALKKAKNNSVSRRQSRLWQRNIRDLRDKLNDKDKEIERLRNSLNVIKAKRDGLENEMNRIKDEEDRIRTLNTNLQNKLLSISAELDKKEEKIKELNAALKRPQHMDYGRIDILKGKIALQNEQLKRVSALYNDLKGQLKEVADIISKKEDEVAEKDKDIKDLNDSIAYLKLKLSNMDEALRQSKKNQYLVIEKLSEATNLNKTLQERIGEVKGLMGKSANVQGFSTNKLSPSLGDKQPASQSGNEEYHFNNNTSSEEKNDASRLKKRVEIMLRPSQ